MWHRILNFFFYLNDFLLVGYILRPCHQTWSFISEVEGSPRASCKVPRAIITPQSINYLVGYPKSASQNRKSRIRTREGQWKTHSLDTQSSYLSLPVGQLLKLLQQLKNSQVKDNNTWITIREKYYQKKGGEHNSILGTFHPSLEISRKC